MSKTNENTYILKNSNKPVANSIVAYLASFLYFAVIVCIALGAIFGIKSENYVKYGLIFGIALLCILGILIFLNFYFEWFLDTKIVFNGNEIVYSFNEVVSVLGHTEVKDKIKRIDKIVVKPKKVIIYGDILHYEPAQKPKSRNKLEIPVGFNNQEQLIDRLNKFKEN